MNLAEYEKLLDSFMSDDIVDNRELELFRSWLREHHFNWEGLAALRNTSIDYLLHKLEAAPDPISKRDALNAVRSLGKITATLWKYGIETCAICNPHKTTAYFAPKDDLGNVVIENLKKAKFSILIAVFTITDDLITNTLTKLSTKTKTSDMPLQIRILTDDQKIDDAGSDILKLSGYRNISIRKDTSFSLMHHKFAVIDGQVLLNGSFNWTHNAKINNYENLSVTKNPAIIKMFIDEFESIWLQCSPYSMSLNKRTGL